MVGHKTEKLPALTERLETYAEIGARLRLEELQKEATMITDWLNRHGNGIKEHLTIAPPSNPIQNFTESLKQVGGVIGGSWGAPLVGVEPTRPHRKRRTMSAAERKQVSRRMSKYWAAKRSEKARMARAVSPAIKQR